MRKNVIHLTILTLSAMLFAHCVPAQAQQPTKIPRIGYLTAVALSDYSTRIEAFRQGLREHGYLEGKNIVIEWRSSEGQRERTAALAAELVRLKVDLIVSGGLGATRAAKAATSTIPIVMTRDSDPVGNGFVASLAHPGGNITGLSNLASDLVGKRLELLKEIVPKLFRLAVFGTSTNADDARELREIENTAGALGVKVHYLDILTSKDIDTAFRAAAKARVDAVVMNISGPIALGNRKEIAELAVKNRLPAIYSLREYVEAGGLMNYGADLNDSDRRAAIYVDKILKGAKPGDLPVEQPKKFEFIINLKAAKQINLSIPPNVLVRADKVIR
jgi:putative tryptophan/tyrosine transport system substrate-binding protein